MDNIIVVNVPLCRKTAYEESPNDKEEEFNICLWQTLIHEIRHSECSMPFIPAEMICEEEASESGGRGVLYKKI